MNEKNTILKIETPHWGATDYVITNKARSVYAVMAPALSLKRAMGTSSKKFFHGRLEGEKLILDKEAPWQPW